MSIINPTLKSVVSDAALWESISKNNHVFVGNHKKRIEYVLHEYGTTLPCNRFTIGNFIEDLLRDFLEQIGHDARAEPNAKRIDVVIKNYGPLSVKYSSTSNIKLHNSNNSVNKDMTMTDLVLLTPKHMWLITNAALKSCGLDVNEFLKNTGDGLLLKRSILTAMQKVNYPYVMPVNLIHDKNTCKHNSTHTVFSRHIELMFNNAQNRFSS